MTTHSYHIFYFPFSWEITGTQSRILSQRINLTGIHYKAHSEWLHIQNPVTEEEATDLYNEKNYYYRFVHNILYDEAGNPLNLIRHYERQEPQQSDNVKYLIKVKGRPHPYVLTVDAININLYSTGVGFLSFYLKNDRDDQKEPDDILAINQYGRRVMPPFYADIIRRSEISEYIDLQGLTPGNDYKETFADYKPTDNWKPASFITTLIYELADNITVNPIIDDRLFVACWYKNQELANKFTENPQAYCDPADSFSSFWYKFLYIDSSDETCQNNEMKTELLKKHTYLRWQKWSSLYGVSRYSLVYLTNPGAPDYLLRYFQTIYARMTELVLVQRASMLRFSGEVTLVSNLSHQNVEQVSKRISSLYKEYIRFMNQIYFREITAQDQGTELYDLLQSSLKLEEYIKDLDGEIGELHEYISLKEDRSRNEKASFLNDIATLLLPITVVTGFFGMNKWDDIFEDSPTEGIYWKICILLVGVFAALIVIFNRKKKL